MNKQDLVDALAKETRLSKTDMENTINALIRIVQNQVKSGHDVTLMGFGTFTSLKRKARRGYDPHNGKEIEVPAMLVPKFRPGKEFKEVLKK